MLLLGHSLFEFLQILEEFKFANFVNKNGVRPEFSLKIITYFGLESV